MKGLLGFIFMNILGAIGWWLGSFVGLTTAVVLAMVASGFGLWVGQWIFRNYLE